MQVFPTFCLLSGCKIVGGWVCHHLPYQYLRMTVMEDLLTKQICLCKCYHVITQGNSILTIVTSFISFQEKDADPEVLVGEGFTYFTLLVLVLILTHACQSILTQLLQFLLPSFTPAFSPTHPSSLAVFSSGDDPWPTVQKCSKIHYPLYVHGFYALNTT